MKTFVTLGVATAIACGGSALAQTSGAVLDADRGITLALERADRATAERWLDADFSWIDPDGILYFKDDAFRAGLRPLVGTGDGVQVVEHNYNRVVFVQRSDGRARYSGRFWVQRPAGWRLLHMTDVEVRPRGYQPVRPDFEVPCINPCRELPWKPVGAGEKAALEGWKEQESSAAGWVKRTAENYDQRPVNTFAGAAPPKSQRIPIVEKVFGAQPHVSPASPILWVRSWDFDDAVVAIMIQPAYGDKAYWASRIFADINGVWQMAESYHNYIQHAPIMTAVPVAASKDPRAMAPLGARSSSDTCQGRETRDERRFTSTPHTRAARRDTPGSLLCAGGTSAVARRRPQRRTDCLPDLRSPRAC
jgi:hypothetical protein